MKEPSMGDVVIGFIIGFVLCAIVLIWVFDASRPKTPADFMDEYKDAVAKEQLRHNLALYGERKGE